MLNDPAQVDNGIIDDFALLDYRVEPEKPFQHALEQEQYLKFYEATSAGRTLAAQQTLLRFNINNDADIVDMHDSYLVLRQRFTMLAGAWSAAEAASWAPVNGTEKQIRRAQLSTAGGAAIDNYNNDQHIVSLLKDLIIDETDEKRNYYSVRSIQHERPFPLSLSEPLTVSSGAESLMSDSVGGLSTSLDASTVGTSTVDHVVRCLKNHNPVLTKLRASSNVKLVAANVFEVESYIPLKKIFSFFEHFPHVTTRLVFDMEIELHAPTGSSRHFAYETSNGNIIAAQIPDAARVAWSWAPSNACYVLLRKVTPTAPIYQTLKSRVAIGEILDRSYPDQLVLRQPFLGAGTQENWRVTNQLGSIGRVWACFQKQSRSDTASSTAAVRCVNPHCFDKVSLQNISLSVSGVPYPTNRYEPRWDLGADTQAERLRCFDDWRRATGSPLSYSDWSRDYTVYCFDARNGMRERGNNEVVLRWEKAATVADYNAYVIIEYEKLVHIEMNNTGSGIRLVS